MNEPYAHVSLIVAVVVAAIAAWFDWRRGEIPNWLTYGALVLGPFLHAGRVLASRQPMEIALTEGGYSIVGALACSIVPALLYKQGAIGGGDLKLLAAIGALLQTYNGVEAQMYGFFAAALVAPAYLAYRGKLFSTLKNAFTILANMFRPKTRQEPVAESTLSWFRLGPPLFFGVLVTAYLHW
ncbi:MAG: A24 family peptidase [Polyangiaceae bacterium]|nr:A24 family peptidase [Polyangiaceae bacterium]